MRRYRGIMSVPYLNRGESIVLTTHRVSVGSVMYDAMLTNQRLILMESGSDKSEPEIVPFRDIVTVKGGKASTGEPAIILTLNEPNYFSDSTQASIIFTQNNGEKRKHERELWVKKLIELVITSRELEAQSGITPSGKKTGMQPSIRRWEAPEPVRPRSSAAEPTPPTVEPVIITEQEPDALEFFLEEKTRNDIVVERVPGKEPEDVAIAPVPPDEKTLSESLPRSGTGEEAEQVLPLSQQEPDVPPREEIAPKDLFAGIHITPPSQGPEEKPGPALPQQEPIKAYESREQFDCIVNAAAESLQVPKETAPEPEPVKELVVRKTSPLPERHAEESASVIPVYLTPGERRELPGTYAPEISVPVITRDPQDNMPVTKAAPPKRPVVLTAVVAIIVIIALIGGIAIAINYLQGSAYSNTVVTISPSAIITQNPATLPSDLQQNGVRVHVNYPNTFTGTIGSPGHLRQISGTGDLTYPVVMTTSLVQATIQKPDNSGDALTVEIYDNSTLLARRTVTAPVAEINLLIDTRTATSPGLNPGSASPADKPLLGNGSLIYY